MSDAVAVALQELFLANRIMAREGVIDDFGHVSVRHPEDPGRYFLACSRSPEIVTREDLMEFLLDGTPVDQRGRGVYRERVIHGALYQARPDVGAVVHHHAKEVLPFTVAPGLKLRPATHLASVLGHQIPIWDSQAEFGDTNMLVETAAQGESLARAQGANACALLRGHGANCAARSIREVVFIAIAMRDCAELLLRALPYGEPTYLSDGEIEITRELHLKGAPLARAWDYRVARAGFQGL
jgi:ribulose-5-phosphate 4-epimerase/fuculose-1-phosphate aldolase